MRHLPTAIIAGLLASAIAAGCEKPQSSQPMEPTIPVNNKTSSAGQPEDAGGTPLVPEEQTPPVRLEDLASEQTDTAAQAKKDAGSDRDQPFLYTVRRGDTLWSLAKEFLGDGKRWPEIVNANPGLVPEKLAVGRQIVIPPK